MRRQIRDSKPTYGVHAKQLLVASHTQRDKQAHYLHEQVRACHSPARDGNDGKQLHTEGAERATIEETQRCMGVILVVKMSMGQQTDSKNSL